MASSTLDYEGPIRLAVFLFVLVTMMVLERQMPRRRITQPGWKRPGINLSIVVLGSLLVRLLFPAAAIGAAFVASEKGWGILNQVSLPMWGSVFFAFLILDLAIYLQHRIFHAVPALWRLHRMHHSDMDFDTTTGVRFHPLEILLSMGIKIGVILALGAPALAVLIFEVVLNGTSLFNHANIKMKPSVDRFLRRFVVTPDMHRVHHSSIVSETNSNFGFNLPWWDYLLGTYKAQPKLGHEDMEIGLTEYRNPNELGLRSLLTQPFR